MRKENITSRPMNLSGIQNHWIIINRNGEKIESGNGKEDLPRKVC